MIYDLEFDSSNLKEGSYDSESETLFVTFSNGKVYGYEEVPEKLVDDLIKADSQGSFFNSNIRNSFKFFSDGE